MLDKIISLWKHQSTKLKWQIPARSKSNSYQYYILKIDQRVNESDELKLWNLFQEIEGSWGENLSA
jgi:hypothetical protein